MEIVFYQVSAVVLAASFITLLACWGKTDKKLKLNSALNYRGGTVIDKNIDNDCFMLTIRFFDDNRRWDPYETIRIVDIRVHEYEYDRYEVGDII